MILKLIIFILHINSGYVTGDVDYCKLPCTIMGSKIENSGCKCSVDCDNGQSLVPDSETKDYIVQVHNEYREKIAAGKTNFPKASNMGAVVYDDDVAYVAQCYANQCKAGHDICRRTKKYEVVGQNFFMMSGGTSCNDKKIFKIAVDMWYDEINQATEACLNSYSGCSGHFTQVIWASSTNIGCGRISFGGGCYIYCNYGPSGNMLGSPVYQKGSPSCDTDSKYQNLCKTASPYRVERISSSRFYLDKILFCAVLLKCIFSFVRINCM